MGVGAESADFMHQTCWFYITFVSVLCIFVTVLHCIYILNSCTALYVEIGICAKGSLTSKL